MSVPNPGPTNEVAQRAHEAGVPRRFGVGTLLVITAMYALLFGVMRALAFTPWGFFACAMFFTLVGLGQMLLFKGEHPRRASVIVGAVLAACLGLGLIVCLHRQVRGYDPNFVFFSLTIAVFVLSIEGAVLGYVAGLLIAGVFLLIDKAERRRVGQARKDADPPAREPGKGDGSSGFGRDPVCGASPRNPPAATTPRPAGATWKNTNSVDQNGSRP